MFSVVTGGISFSFLLIDFQGYVWYNYLCIFHFGYYVIARGVINADK